MAHHPNPRQRSLYPSPPLFPRTTNLHPRSQTQTSSRRSHPIPTHSHHLFALSRTSRDNVHTRPSPPLTPWPSLLTRRESRLYRPLIRRNSPSRIRGRNRTARFQSCSPSHRVSLPQQNGLARTPGSFLSQRRLLHHPQTPRITIRSFGHLDNPLIRIFIFRCSTRIPSFRSKKRRQTPSTAGSISHLHRRTLARSNISSPPV